MKKGDEPLRSFGDLMQFYTQQDEPAAKAEKPPKPEKKSTATEPPGDAVAETDSVAEAKPAKQDAESKEVPSDSKVTDAPAAGDDVTRDAE